MYDRIALACKLSAVLFLVDGTCTLAQTVRSTCVTIFSDELDEMSLEEGKLYNDSLIATTKGEASVDRTLTRFKH
jgi:aristolochene synthase